MRLISTVFLVVALLVPSSDADFVGLDLEDAVEGYGRDSLWKSIPEQNPSSLEGNDVRRHETRLRDVPMNETTGSFLVFLAYVGSMTVTSAFIVFLYWSRGLFVVGKVIVYLVSLALMRLSVKAVYVHEGYNFPKIVSCAHFVTGGLLCFSIILYRRAMTGKQVLIPSLSEFMMVIFPIAISFAVGIAASNIALLYSTAAFNEMIASTTPLVTIAFVLFMGKPFDLVLMWPVALVCLGCMLCVDGELHFSMYSFVLVFAANVARAVKSVLQQDLLTRRSLSYDPVELLAWMSIPSTLLMLGWSMAEEGPAPYVKLVESSEESAGIVRALALSCVNACFLNVSVLFVLRELGAVGVQLIAQAKSILTILGGMAFFGEEVTILQFVGFVFVAIGVYWFTRLEKQILEQQISEQQSLRKEMYEHKKLLA